MEGNVTLIVTTEVLREQAAEVSLRIQNMRRQFEEVTFDMEGTAGYWIGEAADEYRQRYAQKMPELEEIFHRLSEHVTDLERIAGVYDAAEEVNTETAEVLPADVII